MKNLCSTILNNISILSLSCVLWKTALPSSILAMDPPEEKPRKAIIFSPTYNPIHSGSYFIQLDRDEGSPDYVLKILEKFGQTPKTDLILGASGSYAGILEPAKAILKAISDSSDIKSWITVLDISGAKGADISQLHGSSFLHITTLEFTGTPPSNNNLNLKVFDNRFSNFPNLQKLTLCQWNIKNEDFSSLSLSTNLIHLNVQDNQINDLTPLQGLKYLMHLDVQNNQINDLTPLQGLKHLTLLKLGNNQINGLTSLQSLTKLTLLDLRNNKINGLTSLQSLTNLSHLNVMQNQIEDFTPLLSLTKLNILDLRNNKINGLTSLQSLTNLSHLNVMQNQIEDFTPLLSLTKLNILDITYNNIRQLPSLTPLANLVRLDIAYNPLTSIKEFSLPHLLWLWIDHPQLPKEIYHSIVNSTCPDLRYFLIRGPVWERDEVRAILERFIPSDAVYIGLGRHALNSEQYFREIYPLLEGRAKDKEMIYVYLSPSSFKNNDWQNIQKKLSTANSCLGSLDAKMEKKLKNLIEETTQSLSARK